MYKLCTFINTQACQRISWKCNMIVANLCSHKHFKFQNLIIRKRGPRSVVGIATGYGLDGPGIESRWGRDFLHLSRPALGPPSFLYNGYRVFSGGKERSGRDADHSLTSSDTVVEE